MSPLRVTAQGGRLWDQGVMDTCVFVCDGLHQQLEWGCGLGGSYVHVPASGESGMEGHADATGQTGCMRSAAGGTHTHTYIYYIYRYDLFPLTVGIIYSHIAQPERGAGRGHCCCLRSCGCSVCLSVTCVARHVCMCLVGMHFQPCYLLHLGAWSCGCLASLRLLGLA